jgi:hypothetical protein
MVWWLMPEVELGIREPIRAGLDARGERAITKLLDGRQVTQMHPKEWNNVSPSAIFKVKLTITQH